MGLAGRWVEIFKSGKHVDSLGREHTYTNEDLDRIINSYDPQFHEAPSVIGHPVDNAPAYGWVEKLKRFGNTLYAQFKQIPGEFEEMLEKGMFKKRSISLYPDLRLRHVGWLGAQPPAVKGLADVAFKEGQEQTIFEFAEVSATRIQYILRSFKSMFAGMRDFIIEKYDIETADKVVDATRLSWLESDINELEQSDSYNEPAGGSDMTELEKATAQITELTTKVTGLETKVTQFTEKNTTLENENKALKASIATTEKNGREKEFKSFCETLVTKGRMKPADVVMAVSMLEDAYQLDSQSFSETEQKTPRVDRQKALLSNGDKVLSFSEVATRDDANDDHSNVDVSEFAEQNVDPAQLEQHKKISALSQKEKISYAEAARKVMNQK